MADTGDRMIDLADHLVAALAEDYTTVTIDGVDHPLTIEWSDDPSIELKDSDLLDPLLWVIDAGETLDEQNGSGFEDYELLVILQMKCDDQTKAVATVRALSKLLGEIARKLRPLDGGYALEWDDGDGASCVKAVRRPRDYTDWATQTRYYQELIVTFRRY